MYRSGINIVCGLSHIQIIMGFNDLVLSFFMTTHFQCNVGEQGGHHSLNAKDNFAFDRGIRLDRGACILDLRRKR